MALSIDRQAFVDTIAQGEGQIGGVLQPPPEGLWGMPPDEAKKLPGYGPDVEQNRAEGRQIMQQLGYGPARPLAIKVTARNLLFYRDPAVLLIDQLKQCISMASSKQIDTPQYFPKILRKDFTVALNLQTSGPDPDPTEAILQLRGEFQLGRLLQSRGRQTDRPAVGRGRPRPPQRGALGDRAQTSGGQRPTDPLLSPRCDLPATLRQGATEMANSLFNGWRMEDVWLDK